MEKILTGLLLFSLTAFSTYAQVDTTYVYNPDTPYGGLDIRIAKSPTNYYYLQEGETFSFRESEPGVRTNTFRDMTSWDSSPYQQGHLREKKDDGDAFVMNYRFLTPLEYNAEYEPGYPLVLVLHGYAERGNCELEICYHADRQYSPLTNTPPAPTDPEFELLNNDHNLLHGGWNHLDAVNDAEGKLPDDPSLKARAFPGFVVFPQNLNGWDQSAAEDAIRIVRLMMKKYNIDPNRVYIEGISNGGHGMYQALKRAPWLFAAAVGMSAVDDGFITGQGVEGSISHIPLWIFQGGFDTAPSPGKTRRYVQQFRSAGADVRYTLYPELGHGTWNQAWKEPDFFTWLLGKTAADIHSFQGSEFICSDEGTQLELPPGYFAYQWEFEGQIIPDADAHVYFAQNPGTYRARFSRVNNPSEGNWNEWSEPFELTVTDAPQANVEQIGTVLLKDLNGYENAQLKSAGTHGGYYWYKDGTLLDLPGNADDTLQVATIAPGHGNGAYTLVVSDFGCLSEPSEPKYVFFNDSAPISLTAPANFTGVSASPSENTVSWDDVSDNEGGFEIWRRNRTSGSSYGPWQMAGIAPANTETFDDTGVEPTVVYQYKIRAVSNSARSAYTPAGATEGLIVETVVDTEAPDAPIELKASGEGIRAVRLSWKPSTDNTRIREYVVYYKDVSVATGSADTTFLLTDLPLNERFDVTVKGMDLSRNLSPASNAVEVSTFYSGLYYRHTTGSWTDLDLIDWNWSEFDGSVGSFTLWPKTQDDFYNFSFDGYLYIENGGSYQFRVGSSDGSRLWVNGEVAADNNGVHDFQAVTSAAMSLDEGAYRVYLQYFEYTELDSLSVEYNGPDTGGEWTVIPHTAFKSDPSVVTSVAPGGDNGPEDSFIVSVWPNPTTQDNINVMVETVLPTPVRLRLLDPVGRVLFDGTFPADEISRGVAFTPPGIMNTGLYVVMVEQGNVRVREKVVVRR
jgi:dienelactone hydrolase